jgi:hypothetical protein
MKCSAIALTLLGSFVAGAYSHPGTSIVERDYGAIGLIILESEQDLLVLRENVNHCEGNYSPVSEASTTAIENLRGSQELAKDSGTLSDVDAIKLEKDFAVLQRASRKLMNSLITMRPIITGMGECFRTYTYMADIYQQSRLLVKAIVEISDPDAKEIVRDFAKDCLENLERARDEYLDDQCPHKTNELK